MTARKRRRRLAFLGSEPAEADVGRARYVVLPVPYERTTSYGKGTKQGPAALIAASEQVELFVEEFGFEPYHSGIYTAPPMRFPKRLGLSQSLERIAAEVRRHVEREKFVILLGGEHTITVGGVSAFLERYPNLEVVQVDAHLDLRDRYQNTLFSHACTMRRLIDRCRTYHVGIRSLSAEEARLVERRRLPVWWARDLADNPEWPREVAKRLRGPVYLTVDVDGLDPSLMPATGTPEPGGLSWWQLTRLIREIAARADLVGADVTELSPHPALRAANFTAAKLVYFIVACAEWRRNRVQRTRGRNFRG